MLYDISQYLKCCYMLYWTSDVWRTMKKDGRSALQVFIFIFRHQLFSRDKNF
ncbi:hypothetical protein M404DRAFT_440883 [Pisolithus tinctorius Marx 270]|uniref:Uncharacterized protein n=1 Tax=Pisolithus tinctorius Marx 270 TaxID=870435 RepID=A0A0C3P136_PISTI|nr:hypothetical protein M404DRAFT_440883 [Pisolithus tinctorius Marx 270]